MEAPRKVALGKDYETWFREKVQEAFDSPHPPKSEEEFWASVQARLTRSSLTNREVDDK